MRAAFEKIYETNEWKHGSGEGSLPVHTGSYRRLVERFLRDYRIERVVDFGCGDWQSSRLIEWGGVRYTGIDIVGSVIATNQAQFARSNIAFAQFAGELDALPEADLLIVKDVLQHWSNASIAAFLPVLARYRYALVTNCVSPKGPTLTRDIADGGFRPLDLRQPPFGLVAEELLDFTHARPLWRRVRKPRWRKKVLLVRGASAFGGATARAAR